MISKKKRGKIIIPAGVSPWPQELRVAKILSESGRIVEFIPKNEIKSADIYLDSIQFEIKSPISNKTDKLERNIKRALKQSKNIIYDSSRIKNIQDKKLVIFLRNKAQTQKQIGRLILITKKGEIVDIK